MITRIKFVLRAAVVAAFAVSLTPVNLAGQVVNLLTACEGLPSHTQLRTALNAVIAAGDRGFLDTNMWATVVNRDGVVCAVVFSGASRGDQWLASRVISAQKANTANSLSLPSSDGRTGGLALSTANLYSAVQPGGSLFGLQHSNPVNTEAAYSGEPAQYGQRNDPMVSQRIGGVNVFGGGLALYAANGAVVGGLGVSGSTSCTDHITAWRMRDMLLLDHVPAGVSPTGDDNMVNDVTVDPTTGHTVSATGFGHPTCGFGEEAIVTTLPETHPIGPNP